MYRTDVEPRALRITHNATVGYQRQLAPDQSLSGAHYELRRACPGGRYEQHAPGWLRKRSNRNDGYLILAGDLAALPVRDGRMIACLVNPTL